MSVRAKEAQSIMTKFFSSDLHFGHARIQEFQPNRPQGTIDEMNEFLIANWNETVDPTDTVYFLGDAAMGKIDASLPLIGRLNGHIYCVGGNHDRYTKSYRNQTAEKRDEWLQKYRNAGFNDAWDGTVTLTIEGHGVVDMCHFPYLGVEDHVSDEDRGGQNYDRWRPVDSGRFLLHGHVHGKYGAVTGPRSIDVGIDVPEWGMRPVSENQIAELISQMQS
jgi:calcineurin-like phosphoesterase family protein